MTPPKKSKCKIEKYGFISTSLFRHSGLAQNRFLWILKVVAESYSSPRMTRVFYPPTGHLSQKYRIRNLSTPPYHAQTSNNMAEVSGKLTGKIQS